MSTAARSWGEWLLGDLATVAGEVSRLVGPSVDASRLQLLPPSAEHGPSVPTAVVVVRSPGAAERIRGRLLHGEFEVEVYEPLFGDTWQAEVNGLVVRIECEEA